MKGMRPWALSEVVALALLCLSCQADLRPSPQQRSVRFGIVTDCHYADIDPSGTRFYRQSLDKLATCAATMKAEKVDFLVELGDFKDQDKSPAEQYSRVYLDRAEEVLERSGGPLFHVLGNHDMDSLSKQEVLARIRNTGRDPARPYYSFDGAGLHCVVLDANYRADGVEYDHGNFEWMDSNIPASELDWLGRDLATAAPPVIVFIHQPLDGSGSEYVKDAAQVRQVLEQSGKVLAVFQGHRHKGDVQQINGIHYYTLKAVIEGDGPANNAYAIVEIRRDRSIAIRGFGKVPDLQLTPER
jgi:predicted phosphodiesterase